MSALRISRRLGAAILLQTALAIAILAMAWRVVRTPQTHTTSGERVSTRLAWVDRSGSILEWFDVPARCTLPRLSPDGRSLLLTRIEPGKADIWRVSFSDRAFHRLTLDPVRSSFAVWSPDGRRFAFASWRRNRADLFQRAAAGHDERGLLETEIDSKLPEDWSADGGSIIYTNKRGLVTAELWILRADSLKTFPLLETAGGQTEARFSPEGKWIAFTSNATGREEVYLTPAPVDAADVHARKPRLIRVSQDGGHSPQWGRGGELVFLNRDRDLMTARWEERTQSVTNRRKLFRAGSFQAMPDYDYRFGGYCFDTNRERFLFVLNRNDGRMHLPGR